MSAIRFHMNDIMRKTWYFMQKIIFLDFPWKKNLKMVMHYCLDNGKCKEIRISKQFQNNFVIFSQIESNSKHYLEMDQLSLKLIYSAKSWSNWTSRGCFGILRMSRFQTVPGHVFRASFELIKLYHWTIWW